MLLLAMRSKLFTRSVRNAIPDWKISEAANGETALKLVEQEQFDLIFLDQYMVSSSLRALAS